jgi:hypothetical protein
VTWTATLSSTISRGFKALPLLTVPQELASLRMCSKSTLSVWHFVHIWSRIYMWQHYQLPQYSCVSRWKLLCYSAVKASVSICD